MVCAKCGKEFEGKLCPGCGSPAYKNPAVGNEKRKSGHYWWIFVVVLIFSVGMVTYAYFDTHPEAMPSFNFNLYSGKMTLEKYNQINTGMTKNEVTKIIGSSGKQLSSVELLGIKTEIREWDGVGEAGANADVTFQNDKVVAKGQYGLK